MRRAPSSAGAPQIAGVHSLDLASARNVSQPTIALAGWPSSDDGPMRLLGWWYLCIGLAFILLAARAFVEGAPTWSSWLRVAIAAGFVLLGIFELRRVGSRRK